LSLHRRTLNERSADHTLPPVRGEDRGGYVNFMSDDDQERIRANYKGNYDRLVDVKRKYDPDNHFRLNQNIKP
jgi:hypothetical protein